MDYQGIVNMVAEIIGQAFPIALIFGIAGKLARFFLNMALGGKIDV